MASIGLRINQPAGFGVDTGVADVFAKALFGDPEAAAKVAIAKAQIANYGASTANYGATTAFTNSKTQQNEAELAARKAGVGSLAELMGANLAPLTPTETPRPSPDFQGPGIVRVQPAAIERDRQIRHALPGIAEAALVGGGGNAEQIMKSAGIGAGMTGLLAPTPETVRASSTLYTGTAPNDNTVLMPGDTAGTDAQIRINEAKPDAAKTVVGPDKVPRVMVRDPTAPGGFRVADLPGMPVPVESGPYGEGSSDDARDIQVLLKVKKLQEAGEPIPPDLRTAYDIAYSRQYAPKTTIGRDPSTGRDVATTIEPNVPASITAPEGLATPVATAPTTPQVVATPEAPAVAPVVAGPPVVPDGAPVVPTVVAPAVAPAATAPAVAPAAAGRKPAPWALPEDLAPVTTSETTPGGKVTQKVSGPRKDPNPIESDKKNYQMTFEAVPSFKLLDDIKPGQVPSGIQQIFASAGQTGITSALLNSLSDEKARSYVRALQTTINTFLRRDTGAVISPEEFQIYSNRFVMTPNGTNKDYLETRRNRMQAVLGVRRALDGAMPRAALDALDDQLVANGVNLLFGQQPGDPAAAGGAPAGAAPAAGPQLQFNPKTGKLEPVQ